MSMPKNIRKDKQITAGDLIQGVADDVDESVAVELISTGLGIPNVTTSSGLRKAHKNFEEIYDKLKAASDKYSNHKAISNGISKIFSCFYQDANLRNKLLERGHLDGLFRPGQSDMERATCFLLLKMLVKTGSQATRASLALISSSICDALDGGSIDHLPYHIGSSVLSTTLVTAIEANRHPQIVKKLETSKILRTAIRCMSQPFSCAACVWNGTNLIRFLALLPETRSAFQAVPDATKIIVAGTRSNDWCTRAMCLGALMQLGDSGVEDSPVVVLPLRLWSIVRGTSLPANLAAAQRDYGKERCDSFNTVSRLSKFSEAVADCADDGDLHALGLKLYDHVTNTESFSNTDIGLFDAQKGQVAPQAIPGLPFRRYIDALPLCAKVIQLRNDPTEADIANVLNLRFLMLPGGSDEAVAKEAQKCIDGNPDHAYYYYALSTAQDPANGLQTAKKGLSCTTGLTPFVKYSLIIRSVHHATALGLLKAQQTRVTNDVERLRLGVALLCSAFKDARRFLEEAPPDAGHLKDVVYQYILLAFFLLKDIGPNCPEIKFALEKLSIADGFYKLITGDEPPKNANRRAVETILKLFEESIAKYGDLFHRTNVPKLSDMMPQENPLLNFFDLDNDVFLHTGEDWSWYDFGDRKQTKENPLVRYHCSRCDNPSAGLRKCSRCGKARYCDAICQKGDWPKHKKHCKRG